MQKGVMWFIMCNFAPIFEKRDKFKTPIRSLGFMLELNLFLADCKDFDEDVARYVKTKCETKRKNKAAMT